MTQHTHTHFLDFFFYPITCLIPRWILFLQYMKTFDFTERNFSVVLILMYTFAHDVSYSSLSVVNRNTVSGLRSVRD